MNYLPEDIFSLILKKRTEEMKKDKEIKDNKKNYNKVMEDIDRLFFFVLSGKYYYNQKNILGIDGEYVSNYKSLDYITPYNFYT